MVYPTIAMLMKSWGNFWWPAHFQRPHCKNCSILQRSGPFWQSMVHNLLSTGLLQCSSSWTTMMHNQTFTDDSECCSTIGLQRIQKGHVTPLFISLHWLPVAACIKFKTLMLVHKTAQGSAPFYFHSLITIYIPSRSLRSVSERRLVVPSQRGSKSLSRTFSFTVPGWWNDFPTPIRTAGSLSIFKWHPKTHLFHLHLISAPYS